MQKPEHGCIQESRHVRLLVNFAENPLDSYLEPYLALISRS
jgi:hypothetical protein